MRNIRSGGDTLRLAEESKCKAPAEEGTDETWANPDCQLQNFGETEPLKLIRKLRCKALE